MEIRLFLANIVRSWYILVAMMLIGLVVAGAHFATTEPSYSSSARLQVSARSTSNVNDAAQAQSLAVQLAVTYAQLAGTELVLEPAAKRSGVDVTGPDLTASVASVAIDSTPFITITATADSATDAARIAEAVSQQLIAATRSNSSSSVLELREVQPANTPTSPKTGTLQSELPLGLAIGLIIGLVIVLLRDRFDARFRSLGGIASATGLDVLGVVPNDRRGDVAATALPVRSPDRYESFRALRTALTGQGLLPDTGAVLAFPSSVPGEGRSSVVAALAVAIAASGRNVVVVEADLRRPRLAKAFGLEAGPGLTDVLAGTESLDSVLQRVPDADRIEVLRAGAPGGGTSDPFESDGFVALLAELRDRPAVVLVDSPPLLVAADAAAIARSVDHVILVVGAPVVKEREAQRALTVLHQVQVTAAGVVVTRIPKLWADTAVGSGRSGAGQTGRTR